LNPMEFLKWLHGVMGGAKYPTLSLIVFMALCAAGGGLFWRYIGEQAKKDEVAKHSPALYAPPPTEPPQTPIVNATTTGVGSPVIVGNGITYTSPPAEPKKKPPPK
jgi:hypothetical protein